MAEPIARLRRLELSFEKNMPKYVLESYVKNEAGVTL